MEVVMSTVERLTTAAELTLDRRGFVARCSQLIVSGWWVWTVRPRLLYSTSHLWVRINDGVARIGISTYAAQELGDIVFVDLPSVGLKVDTGRSFGIIEAVKTVVELPAPLSGSVIRINDSLEAEPHLVNESPLDRGWLIEMSLPKNARTDHLMSSSRYRRYIQNPAP
jgi:glycine cleavage system H protein